MLWVLLGILAFGGALAVGNDLLGGDADHSRAIAAVAWSSALLLYLGRAWISPHAMRSTAVYAAGWAAIAAVLGLAWVLYFGRS